MNSPDRRCLAALLLVVLLAHGLLLVNDGVYWDGWLVLSDIRSGHWDSVRAWYMDAGLPIHYAYLRLLAVIPGPLPVVANFASFICLVLSSWCVFGIAKECGLGRLQALFIGGVAVTFPSFHADCQLVLSPYLFSLAAFLGAVWLALRAEPSSGAHARFMREGAALLFIIGFGLSSLLVFYLGFLLLFALLFRTRKGFALRIGLYAALPVIFWIAKTKLVPTNGLYSDYNGLHFTADTPHLFVVSLRNGIAAQFPLMASQMRRFYAMPLIFGVGILAAIAMRKRMSSFPEESASPLKVLGYAAFLLVCAVLPYALVGKYADSQGWDTRHAILISIPVAIGLVALGDLAAKGPGKWFAPVVLASAVALFTASSFTRELSYIDRTAKDKAIVAALPSSAARNFSILWIDDQFPPGHDPYRFYEWTSMFRESFGDQRRLGLTPGGQNLRGALHFALAQPDHYGIAQFNRRGAQANLQIEPTPAYSPERTAFEYIAHRFMGRESMERFLAGLVQLRVTPH